MKHAGLAEVGYQDFLTSKAIKSKASGIDVHRASLNSRMFEFQRDIVRHTLLKGKFAIWADCGMGKTIMQLDWAANVPGSVLILAPLAVAQQTVREGAKFGIDVQYRRDGEGDTGITDFRGTLIHMFQDAGFIYHSEVCIWKDPVTAMQRTKALGLLHKQIKKDSCMSRQGIADYLVTMRKPGENPERVTHTAEDFPVSLWQRYASPIWADINPSDTLQRESAREQADERHICPLQLEVIRRALKIWTNPGDTVLSPFMGIGSEGYVAIEQGRRFIGIELKESYYKQAVLNLKAVEQNSAPLFAEAAQ